MGRDCLVIWVPICPCSCRSLKVNDSCISARLPYTRAVVSYGRKRDTLDMTPQCRYDRQFNGCDLGAICYDRVRSYWVMGKRNMLFMDKKPPQGDLYTAMKASTVKHCRLGAGVLTGHLTFGNKSMQLAAQGECTTSQSVTWMLDCGQLRFKCRSHLAEDPPDPPDPAPSFDSTCISMSHLHVHLHPRHHLIHGQPT